MRIFFTVIGVCLSFLLVLGTIMFVTVGFLMLAMGPGYFLQEMSRGHMAGNITITFGIVFMVFLAFLRGVIGVYRGRVERVIQPHKAQADANETQLIQEIHHGLMNFEKRIEALETLLLDRERVSKY